MARNRAAEKLAVLEKRTTRLCQLIDDRDSGKLERETIKLAQLLLLCALPYSRTRARYVTRRARLGDGTELSVTFGAGKEGVELPFGSDRRLMAWLIDRAAQSESPFVPWEAAWEYQREVGMSHSGRSNQRLQESFLRLRGLSLAISHKDYSSHVEDNFSLIRRSYLPRSIRGDDDRNVVNIADFPESKGGFGLLIDPLFHQDIRRTQFHAAIPRGIWRQLRGSPQVQDIALFLYWRCYAAKNESVVPWSALEGQYGPSSNPRRQREYAREAVNFLHGLWPGCTAEIIDTGIMVDYVTRPLLLNDASAKRVRLLHKN